MFAFAKKVHSLDFFKKLVEKDGYAVIDTRSPVEYRDGTLYNAPNAPLRNFMPQFVQTVKDTKKVVLIGSQRDTESFEACIRYAEQVGNVKLYYYYHS